MKTVRLGCALLLLLATVAARSEQTVDPQKAVTVHSGDLVFSIFPKSFQKNPVVDFTVITEMTAEGRKVAAPSPEKPVYYATVSGTFLQLGQGAAAGEKSPTMAELEEQLRRALAANGYLPTTSPQQNSSLIIMFYWGSHTPDFHDAKDAAADSAAAAPATGSDGMAPFSGAEFAEDLLPIVLSDLTKRNELIARASLIGGLKFAYKLNSVLDDEARLIQVDRDASRAAALVGNPNPDFQRIVSPFHRYLASDPKIEMLVEEAFSSCYFVVASAYDCAALAKGENRLLWRTKMTVNALGISMREALPTLIATSAPYLGRDMKEAEVVSKRVVREGRVEIGTPTVVEEPAVKP